MNHNYLKITQKLLKNFSKTTQKLLKNYSIFGTMTSLQPQITQF